METFTADHFRRNHTGISEADRQRHVGSIDYRRLAAASLVTSVTIILFILGIGFTTAISQCGAGSMLLKSSNFLTFARYVTKRSSKNLETFPTHNFW